MIILQSRNNHNDIFPQANQAIAAIHLRVLDPRSKQWWTNPKTRTSNLFPSRRICFLYNSASSFSLIVFCESHVQVSTPLKNMSSCQLGWWHSQFMESHNPFMFQTTNQSSIFQILFGVFHHSHRASYSCDGCHTKGGFGVGRRQLSSRVSSWQWRVQKTSSEVLNLGGLLLVICNVDALMTCNVWWYLFVAYINLDVLMICNVLCVLWLV